MVDGDTYLFWIQPGKGDTDWERVNWCNLRTREYGQVGWIDSGTYAKRNNTSPNKAYQEWFVDYDFTVESSRDIQNSSTFCALTILSGQFGKRTPEDEVNPPNAACAASVLMQKQEDGSLAVVYYHETDAVNSTVSAPPTQLPHHAGGAFNRHTSHPVGLRVHGQHLCPL